MYMKYSYTKNVSLPFTEAITHTRAALDTAGFGIITEINVQAKLKEKLNIDFDNYLILGACNPAFAHKALEVEYAIGLFLPCNVIVYEKNGVVSVSAILPTVAMNMIENPALHAIAQEVELKLKEAIDNL